jgi:type IV pilus assembly protein PilV
VNLSRDTTMLKREQTGVMLLEALIAILIFSIGILAVVGMQSIAIKNVSDAKVRSDAGFLVNELLAQIWTDKGNINSYVYPGSGPVPVKIQGWVNRVNARLPDAAANPPIIAVTGVTASGGVVQVTLRWRMPEEVTNNFPAHQHSTLATIAYNP